MYASRRGALQYAAPLPQLQIERFSPHTQLSSGIADRVKNFAVLYVCDLDQVPDFKQMYELYDPVTLMFFFRNKHMVSSVPAISKPIFFLLIKAQMCDFGTGNNNKLNWVLEDKQELIDIIETIYRGAKKGRGLVVSPKGMLSASCFGVL